MTSLNYGRLTTLDELAVLAKKLLEHGKPIGFDIETGYDGPDRLRGSLDIAWPGQFICGFSITNNRSWARYVPVAHEMSDNLPEAEAWEIIKPVLETLPVYAHNCLSGDTRFVTRQGVQRLDEALGVQEVLTSDGWHKAQVRSYGMASTRAVTFAPYNRSRTSTRRVVRATDNHRWEMRGGGVRTTASLRPGSVVKAQLPEVPEVDQRSEGFIHGLIFADGALTSRQPQGIRGSGFRHQIRLCGEKARFVSSFDKVSYYPSYGGDPMCHVASSVNMKELPPSDASPEYVAAFFEGWQVLDGTNAANPHTRILQCVQAEAIDWAEEHAWEAGWLVTGRSSRTTKGYSVCVLHTLVLSRDPDMAWAVKEIGESGPVEEVYCAEVEGPERFTLEHGIYTGNSKFEKRNLRAIGWKGRGPAIEMLVGGDTMLQEYVLSEVQGNGLKSLVEKHFDHKMKKIEELFPGFTKKQIDALRFNTLELTPEVVNYACEDAAWCLALRDLNEEKAQQDRPVMYRLEHEIMEVLCDVEDRGMHVEWAEMEAERQKAHPFLARMEKATKAGLAEMAGRELPLLNLNSPKQMQELLYRDMGLKTTRMTKGANSAKNAEKEPWQKMSTDKEALAALAKENPALKKLLELREVENALNRFDKWLDENHYAQDDRAHPNFNQVIVPTGRFAAADPPVQQMPKEWRFSTVLGKAVWDPADWASITQGEPYEAYWVGNFRDYLSAAPGRYLIGFDYSQIELRVMAGVSREPILLDAFAKGIDVHSVTAAMMLDKPLASVDKKLDRPIGKTMNFALLYQMGWQSLAERLAVSPERAKQLYANYFAQFASITNWMGQAKEQGIKRGYAETPFGRRVTVWDLESNIPSVRAKGERVLINAPIQGGAADYMKIAMIRCKKTLISHGLWGKVMLIHNLHDALVFEVEDEVNPAELREILQAAVVFPVKGWPKVVADWELGQRHGSMTPWTDEPVEFDGHWQVVGQPSQPPVAEPGAAVTAEEPRTTAYVERTPPPAGPGVEVVVSLNRMPDAGEVERFRELLSRNPGENEVILRMPEGEVRCPHLTSVNVRDQGVVSMIFSGATIRQSAASVDVGALSEGLTL